MSKDFPSGNPAAISKITTSPNSFKETKCARVPPICPDPISDIFFSHLINSLLAL